MRSAHHGDKSISRIVDRRPAEEGQTLVVASFFFVVLISLAGVLIDGGNYLLERRDMQGVADAAAMAGAREIPRSSGLAENMARDYIVNQNSAEGATARRIDVSGNRIEVVTERRVEGAFTQFLGVETPTVSARAVAEYSQAAALEAMLPLAMMRDSYTIGANTEIKTDTNNTGNRGAIKPHGGNANCDRSSGANDFANFVKTSKYGGVDACAVMPGQTVETETGNMAGKAREGFNARIGTNSQSFDDVFEIDPQQPDRYKAKDPTSPRIGIVPVIENEDRSTTWPKGQSTPVRIVAYVLVYIGHTGRAGNPAHTNNGKEVWVTPLKTILPENLRAEYSQTFNGFDDAPVSIRLVD